MPVSFLRGLLRFRSPLPTLPTTRPITPKKWFLCSKRRVLRAEADLRNGKITYKIRELSLQKLPYILVVGAKEKAEGKVAVRVRGGKDLGAMSVEDFIKLVQEDVATRRNVNEIE